MPSLSRSPQTLSFELFPPKTAEGMDKLKATVERLNVLKPEYFSVTYGAGGSTQDRTFEAVSWLRGRGLATAPHLSCIGSSRAEIVQLLERYQALGIDRLVALRGDMPSGMRETGDFRFASELVAFVRTTTGAHFHIEVAAYPEFHPQAPNAQRDLEYFRDKVLAGADGAITQYFFNADAYFRFVDSCERMGVRVPVVPGVMPIGNFSQLARFSDSCGAEIPRWLRLRMESLGDDSPSIRQLGLDVVTELAQRLLDGGAPGLHFYTMNQSALTLAICENLGLTTAAMPRL